jgi:hypothetical protein
VLVVATLTTLQANARLVEAPVLADGIADGCSTRTIWLSSRSLLVLRLSSGIRPRVDVWFAECVTVALMCRILRAAVSALNKTISEIDDVCVHNEVLQHK